MSHLFALPAGQTTTTQDLYHSTITYALTKVNLEGTSVRSEEKRSLHGRKTDWQSPTAHTFTALSLDDAIQLSYTV